MSRDYFAQIVEFLKAVDNMVSQGRQMSDGLCLSDVRTAKIEAEQILEDPSGFFRISVEDDPESDATPSRVEIRVLGKHRARLSIDGGIDGPVFVEGNFNDWGRTGNQSWAMEKENGEYACLLDTEGFEDGLYYRFVSRGNSLLDPKARSVHFLPGVGACSRLEWKDTFAVRLVFRLKEESELLSVVRKKGEGARRLAVVAHPLWLVPENEEAEVDEQGVFSMPFELRVPDDERPMEAELAFGDPEAKESGAAPVSIPIVLRREIDAIVGWPAREAIAIERLVARGEEVDFTIPMKTAGAGKLSVVILGVGCKVEKTLESETADEKSHEIAIRVDTSVLTPALAKCTKIRVLTDSQIANRRYHELQLGLRLASIRAYPSWSLDLKKTPKGASVTRTLEFFRSDTNKILENVNVDLPFGLGNVVAFRRSTNIKGGVEFKVETADMDPDVLCREKIPVSVACGDGLVLRGEIAFSLDLASSDAFVVILRETIRHRGTENCLKLQIANQGGDIFTIFELSWRKGKFLGIDAFGSKLMGKWPDTKPGEKSEIFFVPRKPPPWFWPRRIDDTVEITANWKERKEFVQKVVLWQPSRVAMAIRCMVWRLRSLAGRTPQGEQEMNKV